jgi:hypothetical protein
MDGHLFPVASERGLEGGRVRCRCADGLVVTAEDGQKRSAEQAEGALPNAEGRSTINVVHDIEN